MLDGRALSLVSISRAYLCRMEAREVKSGIRARLPGLAVQGDKRQLQDSPARASEDCVARGANGETKKGNNPKSGQEESRYQLNASPDLGFCIT